MNNTTKTLGQICDEVKGVIRTGPFGSQLHESDYVVDGLPVVMPKNIVEGKIDTADIARINNQDEERLSDHKLNKGDIVYGRRGDIGRRAYVSEREEGWLCGTGCIRISIGDGIIDPKFLYYYLGHPKVIGWIKNQAIGATLPNLNSSIIKSIKITYPPLPIQDKIASILSAYDDLIENNTRRISILEEMAQAIYREWFVNFRFPGHEGVRMVESPLGPIPEGWRICSVSDVCALIGSGGTPARNKQEYWIPGIINWFKTKELVDGFLFSSEEKIAESGLNKSSAKIFQPGTIVMAIYAAPTVGRLGILTEPSAFNQACVGLVANKNLISMSFLFYKLMELRVYFNNISQGAAQQNINVQKVRSATFLNPSLDLIMKFDDQVSQILSLIKNLSQVNNNLNVQRDLLLPRLVSGELDVEGLDIPTIENEA